MSLIRELLNQGKSEKEVADELGLLICNIRTEVICHDLTDDVKAEILEYHKDLHLKKIQRMYRLSKADAKAALKTQTKRYDTVDPAKIAELALLNDHLSYTARVKFISKTLNASPQQVKKIVPKPASHKAGFEKQIPDKTEDAIINTLRTTKLSQVEIANMYGVSQATISRINEWSEARQ